MKKYGFTLAETMLVVVILGIIAILVVPQLIRRQVEISNRTKLKKAMAAYDYLMNRMILENDLHSNTALKTWGANCSNSANYFKISQETNNPCVFKTTDGVWWDIENIQQAKVAFDQGDLDLADSDSPKAFYLIAHYDDQGIIRISDNAYEKSGYTKGTDDEVIDGDKAMDKLYSFVKNKKSSGEEEITNKNPLEKVCSSNDVETSLAENCYPESWRNNAKDFAQNYCTGDNETSSVCNYLNGNKSINLSKECSSTPSGRHVNDSNCVYGDAYNLYVFDENGDLIIYKAKYAGEAFLIENNSYLYQTGGFEMSTNCNSCEYCSGCAYFGW